MGLQWFLHRSFAMAYVGRSGTCVLNLLVDGSDSHPDHGYITNRDR